jgi:predicted lipoprotein with Yx(FWY)xxD motif
MNFKPSHFFSALLAVAALSSAHAQPVVTNGVVTDPAGMTLYSFDKDEPLTSHCAGGCLKAWPAYVADSQPGASVSPAAERFGSGAPQQWAWKGKPLYYFAGDAKPGDRNGDGSGGVWHVIRPATKAAASSTSSTYTY